MNSSLMIDTNIVSYFYKNNSIAQLYDNDVANKHLFIAFVVLGELHFWALTRAWSDKKKFLLDEYISKHYTVLYPDALVCQTYALKKHQTRSNGFIVSENDLWIASMAITHNMSLVTHNKSDFEHIWDLDLITHA